MANGRRDIRLWTLLVIGAIVIGTMPAATRLLLGDSGDEHGAAIAGQMSDHDASSPDAQVSYAPLLSRAGWRAEASSQELILENGAAGNVLDGDMSTAWRTRKGNRSAAESITIDMATTTRVSALVVTPAAAVQGAVQFQTQLSIDGTNWSGPVATGTLADDAVVKTLSFPVSTARFVRLTTSTDSPAIRQSLTAAEIGMLGDPVPAADRQLDRTGWTASATSEETAAANNRASQVLDGSAATFWHSKWSGVPAKLPQSITIDTLQVQTISGLSYTSRSGNVNGRIGSYQVAVSTDGQNYGAPVSTGVWADTPAMKTASFAAVQARYVRLTSLAEAGNRGSWANAGEIGLLTPAAAIVQLPRTGWTVAASDEEIAAENGRAARVLDGSVGTWWHSQYTPAPAKPLPHSLTIDLNRSLTVTGLVMTPRTTSPNGRIGGYEIYASADGATYTKVAAGIWPDAKVVQTVTFPGVAATRIRLVALTEAGGRGPWSSVAELNLLGPDPGSTGNADQVGSWGPVIGFPIVPVAAAVLPGNKMLVWAAYSGTAWGGANGYTQTAIMDLSTGVVTQRQVSNTGHDMFCPGTSFLADGRLLVTGGSNASKVSIYDPATNTWSAAAPMNVGRGYQGQTTLSNGDAFVVGGSWSGAIGGKYAEVYNPASNTWRKLTGVQAGPFETNDTKGEYRSDNHQWLFATAGGRIFHAGPSKAMHWVDTAGNGTVTNAGLRGDSADAMNGNAVMYDIGKILTLGGAPWYEGPDATPKAHKIDITTGTAVVTRTGDMAKGRSFANSVVLPDGNVVVMGGQVHPVTFTDTTPVMTPEIWSPTTGVFTPLAPMAVPRTYHSVGLLLPDGRIFSGGGGLCDDCATNHLDGQILTPPYLLNPDGSLKARPSIASAPTTATYGASISVGTGQSVAKFALMRVSSVTHSVDNDQRRIPLTAALTGTNSYSVTIPNDAGVAPPGSYMLFALDAAGTPSIARMVTIG